MLFRWAVTADSQVIIVITDFRLTLLDLGTFNNIEILIYNIMTLFR